MTNDKLRSAATQNERAIAELEGLVCDLMWSTDVRGHTMNDMRPHVKRRLDALRAEQQVAPETPPAEERSMPSTGFFGLPKREPRYRFDPVPKVEDAPPADAPSRPSVFFLKRERDAVGCDVGNYDRDAIANIRSAVLLLLDDALAGRGEGAK